MIQNFLTVDTDSTNRQLIANAISNCWRNTYVAANVVPMWMLTSKIKWHNNKNIGEK